MTHPTGPGEGASGGTSSGTGADAVPVADIAALFDMYQKGLLFHCVCAATRLGVADALASGPRPFAELADEMHADPDALWRVLRLLAGHGYVALHGTGTGTATATGAGGGISTASATAIATSSGIGGGPARSETWGGDVALSGPGLLLGSGHPYSFGATFATLGISDVAHALEGVIRTGRAAAPEVLGAGFWEYLARRPKEQAVFSAAMTEQANLLSLPCVDLLDWPENGTVVDVAGGAGVLLAAILEAAPGARGILVDQPEVLSRADALLAEAGVADRCELRPGDLFAAPPRGEVYVLSRVLHDWDDESVVRILHAVATGAAQDAEAVGLRSDPRPRPRIRIFEDLLPELGLPTPIQSWSDVVMMALYDGARERTLTQYGELLARSGWRLERAVAGPPGINVIEAVLDV